jgi:hypothetical protein
MKILLVYMTMMMIGVDAECSQSNKKRLREGAETDVTTNRADETSSKIMARLRERERERFGEGEGIKLIER